MWNKVVALMGALVAAVALAPLAYAPTAVEYLVTNSTLGQYNDTLGTSLDGSQPQFPCADLACGDPVINPASEPNVAGFGDLGNDWLTAHPFPLGPSWHGPQEIPSTWPANEENAIVYEIDAGQSGLMDVTARFGVDNGIFVWLNGNYLFGAVEPGGAPFGEYEIHLGDLPEGVSYLQIVREDHGGITGYNIEVSGIRKETSNGSPDCSAVAASPNTLWPPDHRMGTVAIGGASDPDGDAVALQITGVTQDEPVTGPGANNAPDAAIGSATSVDLRAERDGSGDGRVYRIAFTGDDHRGGSCAGTAIVGVPHDESGDPATDSGGSYDSTTS